MIYQLSKLVQLDLSNNQLTELPDEIVMCPNLVELNLFKNQLKSLPKSMSSLKRLEILNVSQNKIDVFPQDVVLKDSQNYEIEKIGSEWKQFRGNSRPI